MHSGLMTLKIKFLLSPVIGKIGQSGLSSHSGADGNQFRR